MLKVIAKTYYTVDMIKRVFKLGHRLLNRVFIESLAQQQLSKLADGDYCIDAIGKPVPYQCQVATPALVKPVLEKQRSTEDDPNWQSFGFATKEKYGFWTLRICGIACLKMALDYYGLATNRSLADLTHEGQKLGGYILYDKAGHFRDQGWFHKPLVTLGKRYGLAGRSAPLLTINQLCAHLLQKKLVIISVNPSIIRFDKTNGSEEKGGHLVLALGFRIEKGQCAGIYINNPSGKEKKTQDHAFIPLPTFTDAFNGKGIILWKAT